MAFEPYITYTEYVELGGDLSEDDFPLLERKAQRWLDYFTFNRVKQIVALSLDIPDEVKEVLVEFITRLNVLDSQREAGSVLTSYDNGTESLQFELKTEEQTKQELALYAADWLPNYLVNRSVKFDVAEYLQSESNNS